MTSLCPTTLHKTPAIYLTKHLSPFGNSLICFLLNLHVSPNITILGKIKLPVFLRTSNKVYNFFYIILRSIDNTDVAVNITLDTNWHFPLFHFYNNNFDTTIHQNKEKYQIVPRVKLNHNIDIKGTCKAISVCVTRISILHVGKLSG